MSEILNLFSYRAKSNLISMLMGDVKSIEEKIIASNNKPVPVGIGTFVFDSHLFSYVLHDALLYDADDTDYRGRNIPEMLAMHERICGHMKHPDYSKFRFISWNDGDYWFGNDIPFLKSEGISDIDIELTDVGVQHKEEQVIELLKKGASPYFINRTSIGHYEDKEIHYGYYEVAPLLCVLDAEWCDQWDINSLTLLRKDINTLDNDNLEMIILSLFNAAASQRILYLVDKYISDEARARGEELMRKYNVYHPILRRKP